MQNLETLTIGKGFTTFEKGAFSGLSNLKDLKIKVKANKINADAFEGLAPGTIVEVKGNKEQRKALQAECDKLGLGIKIVKYGTGSKYVD